MTSKQLKDVDRVYLSDESLAADKYRIEIDILMYGVNVIPEVLTRRHCASKVAEVFDPTERVAPKQLR